METSYAQGLVDLILLICKTIQSNLQIYQESPSKSLIIFAEVEKSILKFRTHNRQNSLGKEQTWKPHTF